MKWAHYYPQSFFRCTRRYNFVTILTLMTLCCFMAARDYITNGPQATVSHCCCKVTQVKDTHMCTQKASVSISPAMPKDHQATGQEMMSCHLVKTNTNSGQKCAHPSCVDMPVCFLLRLIHIASHIDVTRQSARLVANRKFDASRIVLQRRSFASKLCWV